MTIRPDIVPQDVEAVVLAAGRARRAGCFKLGLPYRGSTVIGHCVADLAALCRRVIVVGGWHSEMLADLVGNHPAVHLVENPAFDTGMFSSIRRGIREVTASRFFIHPADIPSIPHETGLRLLESDAPVAIPTFGARKGHPLLLSAECIPRLLALPDTASMRDFIGPNGFTAVPVDSDDCLFDIDTVQDYERLSVMRGDKSGHVHFTPSMSEEIQS